MSDEQLEQDAIILGYGNGGATRTRIVESLRTPQTCQSIAQTLNLQWNTVSYHLQKLQRFGYIKVVKFGKRQFYQKA